SRPSGTGAPGRRLRAADRSTGSDNARPPAAPWLACSQFSLNWNAILQEWTRAGLAHALENSQRLGRPATAAAHAAEIRKLHRAGISKSEIARRLNIGRTSVRRI